ncbi:alpha/beta-hydrolase [Saccharata proteae CBS 121410]|uniref:Alpha/beta-hydrolase n=1 Tax=Saccharata proteae CBS 121410 TaxID=1314787 RepID=A0A9P4HMI3_9PEZI|nr:alpha/beta-hydrolase [Saccharata proteae CBS 121410]
MLSSQPSQPTHTSNPKRLSLPPSENAVRPKKRSPNRVRAQAASPEVISSLIDSLSAISLPAQAHFENIPAIGDANEKPRGGPPAPSQSVPSSPAPWQGNFANDRNGGFGVQYGVHRNERWEDEEIDPNAAEPPVVRTSKPPSVRGREKESSLKNYMFSSAKSSASLHSKRSQDSVGSITSNMVPGLLRRQSTNSRASLDSKVSKGSGNNMRNLKERLQGKENSGEMRKIPRSAPAPILTRGIDTLSPPSSPRMHPPRSPRSPRFSPSNDHVLLEETRKEESYLSSFFKKRPGPISIPSGSSAEPDERSPRVPTEAVPERGSSLRHHSESPSNRRRKPHSRAGSSRTRTVIEEDEDLENARDTKMQLEKEEIDNQTTRRIKELKRQKELRDQEASRWGFITNERTEAVSSPHTKSPSSPDSLPSPGSLSSDNVEERPIEDSTAKAHKLLGLTTASYPMQRRSKSFKEEAKSEAEDASPLPIDYQAALQSLDRSESSHSEKTATSRAPGSFGRSSSAIGRKSPEQPPNGLDYPINFDSPPESRVSSRAASTDPGSRQQSLYVPNQPQRSNSKKKRWSHPDLPLKAEQKLNAKLDRENMAVKAAQMPEPVIEEPPRPSSSDSVDDDVDAFLYSPRLSQKVREPNTGRTICFSEVGDPQGFVVFVCVGMGLTRYITAFYDELAASLKLRLITPDRPGVGESQADPHGTPLSWPEDVQTICDALHIQRFSIMAHSAGAIYALATALRMPQKIRGRVHLLAPWIPPSQMSAVGLHTDSPPDRQLPKAQRLLRVLPTPFLRVANSSFMSATSASITRSVPKSPQRSKKKPNLGAAAARSDTPALLGVRQSTFPQTRRESMMLMDRVLPDGSLLETDQFSDPNTLDNSSAAAAQVAQSLAEAERRHTYDTRLTLSVWDLATTNANPAVDLLVCLERRQSIGFRYVDITRPVVIHHGNKDSRVPVENVRWLGRTMRRCEVRILEDEGHGLMASAAVMGNVLTEMAKEWEEWTGHTRRAGQGPSSAAVARPSAVERLGSYGSYGS